MLLITISKICHLYPIFCKLGEPQQTLFKLFGLFTSFVKLLELLTIVNLVFKSPLHDFLPHLFDAFDEQRFELIPLSAHVNFISNLLLLFNLFSIYDYLQVSNCVSIASLESLHIFDDLILDFLSLHS